VLCPKCGTRVKVKDSRTADSQEIPITRKLLRTADEVVGWYTQDWVVRSRFCPGECSWEAVTIEVPVEDWREMQALLTEKAKKEE
jgi:hypothetical protein